MLSKIFVTAIPAPSSGVDSSCHISPCLTPAILLTLHSPRRYSDLPKVGEFRNGLLVLLTVLVVVLLYQPPEGVRHLQLLRLLQAQGDHRHHRLLAGLLQCAVEIVLYSNALCSVHLVKLYTAVELGQLLLQQLQVGVDEAELEGHGLLHLLVCGGPAQVVR